MNVGQIIKAELQTLLTDLEGTEIGAQVKTYIDAEISRVETELKSYIDQVIVKAFQPSNTSQQSNATSGS